MSTKDALLFFSRFRHSPGAMASITPSGPALAKAMAACVPVGAGRVVEVGPGTGAITAGLLAAGHAEGLLAIERDAALAGVFARRYPAVDLRVGDARDLPELLREEGLVCRAIVSSLGLRTMPETLQLQIAQAFAQALPSNGVWVQYTYGWKPPLPEDLAHQAGWIGARETFVVANLPPAWVWIYRRA